MNVNINYSIFDIFLLQMSTDTINNIFHVTSQKKSSEVESEKQGGYRMYSHFPIHLS